MPLLFVTHPFPNFVPDLLLHGLRKLWGPEVVDFPRKSSLYQGELVGFSPKGQVNRHWFPPEEDRVDREDIPRKIRKGFFQYIFCDVRAASSFFQGLSEIPKGLVIVDGEDRPQIVPPGPYAVCRRETDGSHYSIPLPMALPEEVMAWIQSYDDQPKTYSVGFLGSVTPAYPERKIIADHLSRWYGDCLLNVCSVPRPGEDAPPGWLPRDQYYAEIQKCRILLSVRGAGYDTFRFWENAACRAVHLAQAVPLFIPDDFQEGVHLFRFRSLEDVRRIVDRVLEGKTDGEAMIKRNREHLSRFHTTQARALYLLDRLKGLW